VKRSFIATVLTLSLMTGCGAVDRNKLFATLADVATSVIAYARHTTTVCVTSPPVDASTHSDAATDSE
jgi:hypothetical protein